jgi:cyclopropane fatty-acyl-phospholipid synthase-like methyltransferase
VWSGDPNPQLVCEVAALTPGSALDVGCGEGADAMWLAERGWTVLALDLSIVAIERCAGVARGAGQAIADRIEWRQADILNWTPAEAGFDLVSSQFVHLEASFRKAYFRRLAAAVAPGGTLLIVGHHPSDRNTTIRRPRAGDALFPPEDVVAALDTASWDVVVADARPRTVMDAEGRPVTVHDTVVRARRLGSSARIS